MLQITIGNARETVQCSGNLTEVVADIAYAISIIHESCKTQSTEAAEAFQRAVIAATAAVSPVWQSSGHVAETCICKPESRAATMDELNRLIKAGASPDAIARFLRGQ